MGVFGSIRRAAEATHRSGDPVDFFMVVCAPVPECGSPSATDPRPTVFVGGNQIRKQLRLGGRGLLFLRMQEEAANTTYSRILDDFPGLSKCWHASPPLSLCREGRDPQ